MIASELQLLHGQSVLVRSSRDRRNPPIAVRGTLEVHQTSDASHPEVKLIINFPEMFNAPAHQRTLKLTEAELVSLKAAPVGGLEFMTEQSFE